MKEDNHLRSQRFKKNNELENLLSVLNNFLNCSEQAYLEYYSNEPQIYPVIFLMGPHRSGTTLFMQWLANTGICSYPTNFLSRFYGAPVIGSQIQLLLTDSRFNFRNELSDFDFSISFNSENGKTQGLLAPNEFWYFWRRFLPFKDLDWLPDEDLLQVVDKKQLVAELTTLTHVFNKSFALKAMILNYNIPFLNKIFEKALFIYIMRDPESNVASIIDARRRQTGSENYWYSFKIPEYLYLKDLDPITQCAGQVYYINKAVSKGMESLTEDRKLVVQYEKFCNNPGIVFEQLISKLKISGCIYSGPTKFDVTRQCSKSNNKEILNALKSFSK